MPDMCTDRFSTYFDYVIRTFNNTCKVPGISSTDTMTMLNLPLGDPKNFDGLRPCIQDSPHNDDTSHENARSERPGKEHAHPADTYPTSFTR